MDARLLTLACHACAQGAGEFLLDCQCLLCAECFRAETLAAYLCPAPLCRLCAGETRGEHLRLGGLPERERLLALCNCYAVNCYLQLRAGALAAVAEAQAQSQQLAAEQARALAAAAEREAVFAQFFAWCVARYRVRLEEVDPQILLRDKGRVLRAAFEARAPALNDTKKKESHRGFALNELNPFTARPCPPGEPGPFAPRPCPPGESGPFGLRPSLLDRLGAPLGLCEGLELLVERDSADSAEGRGRPREGTPFKGGRRP